MTDYWMLETDRRRTRLSFERRQVLDYPEVFGVIERVSLGSGLDVLTVDLRTLSDLRLTARDDADADLICGIVLESGEVEQELPEIGSVWLSPRNSVLFRPSRRSADYRMLANQTVRGSAYYIDPSRLRRSLRGEPASPVDALLPDGASGNTSQRFVLPVDPDLRRFAREIMAPGGAAGLRGLRIEARVMDMIAGQLSLLRPGADGDQRGDEGTRVAEAVELLCADLCSPPSPRALARVVGMSERQLQAAFRERLGASVAEYLREQRLAQAHHRLCNDAMSVSEVAERVGYANASNLIKALRRRFGASPSDLRGGAARTTSTGTSGALRARIPDEG